MTVNEKLIDDAVTAFANRDVTAPSRDDLRIALEAFETSLTRCGCEPCTTERRARIALTEHDRTALARALHEVVYSPGSNYDRAVPGIQEHVLACAEKVAAALPWLAPHTPSDDERDCLTLIARDVHLYDGGENAAITGPHARRIADAAIAVGFHRSEVPEPTAGATHRGRFGHVWPCPLFYVGNWKRVDNGHEPVRECTNAAACGSPEPQGEPSDAAARALHIHDTWGTPDDHEGKTRPMSDYTNLSIAMAQALRGDI